MLNYMEYMLIGLSVDIKLRSSEKLHQYWLLREHDKGSQNISPNWRLPRSAWIHRPLNVELDYFISNSSLFTLALQ